MSLLVDGMHDVQACTVQLLGQRAPRHDLVFVCKVQLPIAALARHLLFDMILIQLHAINAHGGQHAVPAWEHAMERYPDWIVLERLLGDGLESSGV